MALQIGQAIDRGVRRPLNSTGILLMVLLFGYMLTFVGSVNTIVAGFLPAEVSQQAQFGLLFPVSVPVAAALVVASFFVGNVLFLVSTRAFTRDPEEWRTFSTALFTRRIGRAVLSTVGANLVVSLAVTVGFILLVVPGIFLSVSFMFVVYAIGVEDARVVDALRRSWELASGHRWRLLGLSLLVGVTVGLLASFGSFLSLVDPAVGQVVSLAISSVLGTFAYGIMADAFVQLRAETDADADADPDAGTDADPDPDTGGGV